MARHPVDGIKGAKPRIPGVKSAESAAQDARKASKAEIWKLSKEYLEVRNRQMHAKAFMAETIAAERRGELIKKELVLLQASYLLVAMRERLLRLPAMCFRRLSSSNGLKNEDLHKIRGILEAEVRACLEELADLPNKVVDPHYLDSLDDEENGKKSE
jgi:hypothetical protein